MKLVTRLASASVLLAVLIASLIVGGAFFDVVIGVAVAIALYEFSGLATKAGASPSPWILYPLAGWLLYRFLLSSDIPALEWGLGVATVVGLLLELFSGGTLLRWATAVGGALYIGLSAGYYLALLRWRMPDPGRESLRIVLTTLGAAMVGDTAAYFVGSAIGRIPFFPRISPRKTVEGAIGGTVATVLGFAFAASRGFGMPWYHGLVLGALIAVAAQGGDLVESAVKRRAGAKDSSGLIPGHGGLLDRIDSLVLVAPVVYGYLRLISLA